MGSWSIHEIVPVTEAATPESAYRQRADQAADEYGNRYDTGTIASTQGFTVMPGIHTAREVAAMGTAIYARTGKHTPLECYRVGEAKVAKRTVTKVLRVAHTDKISETDIAPVVPLGDGEYVASVETLEDAVESIASKIVRSKGKASRVFIVADEHGRVAHQADSLPEVQAWLDEAIRRLAVAATDSIERWGYVMHGPVPYTVTEEVRRDGDPAARIIPVVKRRVKVRVTIERVTTRPTTPTAHHFVGWAAS